MASKASPASWRRYKICAAFFLWLTAASAFAQVSVETESNDTLDGADFIEIADGLEYLHLGFLGNGQSSPDLDVDLIELGISFSDPAPKQLTAVVTGANCTVDLCLRLFDSQGIQVAFNDDFAPANPNAKIAITLYENGPTPYYLGVSSRSNTLYDPEAAGSGRPGAGGDYQLRLFIDDEPVPNSPYEPNDTVYSAAPLGNSSVTLHGEFIGDGSAKDKDVDAYRLQLDGPSMIYATARASAGSVLDPLLRVRTCADSTDGWVMDPCGIGIGDDVSGEDQTAHVQTFVTEPTDLYVLVSGSPNRRYDPAEAASGERGSMGYYDLDIQIEPLNVATPNEPNDSIPLATPLPLFVEGRPAEIIVEGIIGDGPYAHMRGDRDFYQIRLADQATFLHIRSAEESEIVPRFTLFDPEGRLLARSSGIGPSQEMVIPAICGFTTLVGDPTTAYLAVTALDQRPIMDPNVPPSANYGADYTIEPVPAETGNYKITVAAVEPSDTCANEPNETIPTAASTGIVNTGHFACNAELGDNPKCGHADIDMWSVVVDQPPVILHLRLGNCADAEDFESSARVFDSAGHMLALGFSAGDAPQSLTLSVATAGTYIIAVGGERANYWDFDPFEACYNEGWLGQYSIAVSLAQGPPDAPLPITASAEAMGAEPLTVLYGTRVGDDARWIDVLNPLNGQAITSFVAPQWPLSGAESIVASAGRLIFGGIGRYPVFHALTPLTGQVVRSVLPWFGSGQYGDTAMLGGVLYIVDLRQQAIHAVEPDSWRLLRTIPVKNTLSITMTGAMAALSGPNRLYVADAINEQRIYEIDPATGALTGTFAANELRPHALAGLGDRELFIASWETASIEVRERQGAKVEGLSTSHPLGSLTGRAFLTVAGDIDEDGDIDMRDVAALQRCFAIGPFPQLCGGTDLNDDGSVDLADVSLISANLTGL